MTRVAAFDCGTHSLRLLLADVDPDTGALADLHRELTVVRLGEGVDRTGLIAEHRLRRALEVFGAYGRRCEEAGVERLRVVATSASRDARNSGDFVAGVRAVLGVEPEVISGDEEARLSFLGATADLVPAVSAPMVSPPSVSAPMVSPPSLPGVARPTTAAPTSAVPGPYLVVDLGGGSTELVLGARTVTAARSVDVGCLRMTERHLHDDPPTAGQVAAVEADVEAALDLAEDVVPLARAGTLVGLAGSVTTVTAHALGLPGYDSRAIHGAVLPVEAVDAACTDLLSMTREQRAGLPYMHPGRVDVIGGGALVWRTLVRRVARCAGLREVRTSEHDILDGIALSLAGFGPGDVARGHRPVPNPQEYVP